ncbi:MAG: hypothetical protein CML05_15510 [Pseudozobellia sp.]|nr:hypothetical protein [Pseudozobellia sp.]
MRNLYEVIKNSLHFNKFIIDGLVCVEYTCPLEDERLGLFAKYDYIVHVLSGKKTWTTINGEWEVIEGQTLYVRKGAAIITQSFDEDFCMLGFFLPDELIRESLQGYTVPITAQNDTTVQNFSAVKLEKQEFLEGFFTSMLHYFRSEMQPADSIIKLKLKELLLNLVLEKTDFGLMAYLNELKNSHKTSLQQIMETNFCYNLSIEEYAKLCHRSISTFRRDFFSHYQTTPGKWLLDKRLGYAANLLINSDHTITEIAFESGFADVSHFSRVFKTKYKSSPSTYRKVPIQG